MIIRYTRREYDDKREESVDDAAVFARSFSCRELGGGKRLKEKSKMNSSQHATGSHVILMKIHLFPPTVSHFSSPWDHILCRNCVFGVDAFGEGERGRSERMTLICCLLFGSLS